MLAQIVTDRLTMPATTGLLLTQLVKLLEAVVWPDMVSFSTVFEMSSDEALLSCWYIM
jgi:hypothetical protein